MDCGRFKTRSAWEPESHLREKSWRYKAHRRRWMPKQGVHTLGGGEVDDVAVGLEHVDLLDGLDGLSVQLLQGLLKLLVIGAGSGRRTLDLSAGSTLATIFPTERQSDID